MNVINLKDWIAQNEATMIPPVGNKVIWPNCDFIVMIIKGPNNRHDFHVNADEEFFYQLKGDIVLKLYRNNKIEDITINEGCVFLLPPNTPHSPQRPNNSIGMVIEKQRQQGQLDSFMWFCECCNEKLYEESFELTDISKQFPPIFNRFYSSGRNKCKQCGFILSEYPSTLKS